jgi:hypothetical protein
MNLTRNRARDGCAGPEWMWYGFLLLDERKFFPEKIRTRRGKMIPINVLDECTKVLEAEI